MASGKTKIDGLQVKLAFNYETKGTYRYDAVDEDAPVTAVYIRKGGIEGGAPERLTLTLKAGA